MSNRLRLIVTGAAGHLGSHLARLLLEDGHDVIGFDVVKPAVPPGDFRLEVADLTDAATYRGLLQGIDLIVHCASIHPWKKYTDQQYVDANIKGTWVLYATAAEVGIKKVLLTSSIAANAMGGVPMADWPIDEAVHYTPRDIYSFTKFCQEENARSLAVRQQVRTFALRPPAFMPADELQSVFRRTGCFTLVDDIASAHVAAVRVMADEARLAKLGWFEAFYITNDLPYTRADVALLNGAPNPRPLVQKYWPEAYEWLVAHGYEGAWLPAIYDNSKAKRLLGWQPVHNFPEAYRAYRARHPGA